MKKTAIWFLSISFVYYLIGWSSPYIVALKRGGTVVSTAGWYGDAVQRIACINGGNVVFPNRILSEAVEFGVIDKSGNRNFIKLEHRGQIAWCLNRYGDQLEIAAWNDWWVGNEEKQRQLMLITDRGGVIETTVLILQGGPYSLFVTDIEKGSLLGHIKQGADGALFVISTRDGELMGQSVITGEYIWSGVFWSDGLVYRDKGKVLLRRASGRETVLGEIFSHGDIFTKSKGTVAWSSYDLGVSVVHGYSLDGGAWKQRGAYPFLVNDKLILVDDELGGVAMVSLEGGRVLLVKADAVRNPVYLNGKLYWEEETFNISFPVQFIFYLLSRSEPPVVTQSHLFSKNIDLARIKGSPISRLRSIAR